MPNSRATTGSEASLEMKGAVGCCGYALLSNSYHILLDVTAARRFSAFMGYFNSNLAREGPGGSGGPTSSGLAAIRPSRSSV